MKNLIRKGLQKQLPDGFDIDKHFKPPYDPWDQRMCVVPDGDLFEAIKKDSVDIVTDGSTRSPRRASSCAPARSCPPTSSSRRPASTCSRSAAAANVDGKPVVLSETVGYKGMMFSGVPTSPLPSATPTRRGR